MSTAEGFTTPFYHITPRLAARLRAMYPDAFKTDPPSHGEWKGTGYWIWGAIPAPLKVCPSIACGVDLPPPRGPGERTAGFVASRAGAAT